jgi:biotin transport system substrate-specific component|tara:strand:+ start:264 stop:818 length:555 start_codon:yes stop_codon:yes gene_type:complete
MEIVKSTNYSRLVKYIFLALMGTVLIAISSKIKIPFYPVPMTMQTFVVLFIGVSFGWKLGIATVTLYLLEGIFGLPVFSGTPEKGVGFIYFTGPTMGYLIGFLFAVFFAGKFTYSKNILLNFLKLSFAISFIYILGLIWLGLLIGWEKPIFKLGAQPFLLAELFKILLMTFILSKVQKIKSYIQ